MTQHVSINVNLYLEIHIYTYILIMQVMKNCKKNTNFLLGGLFLMAKIL